MAHYKPTRPAEQRAKTAQTAILRTQWTTRMRMDKEIVIDRLSSNPTSQEQSRLKRPKLCQQQFEREL
jgi:hypothetical protein